MDDRTTQKINRIKELLGLQEEIQRELAELVSPEKVVALPPNFSLNNEVYAIVKDAGSAGIQKPNILRAMQNKFPDYGIDRRKVASTLAYLKNTKKSVEIIGRGLYRAL